MSFNLPIFQIVGIIGSIAIIIVLINLVSRRKLKSDYSLLWFGISVIFLLFSLDRDFLSYTAYLLGVDYAPAALFLIMIMGLYMLSLHFSLVISKFREEIKDIGQETGLSKLEIEKLKEKLEKK